MRVVAALAAATVTATVAATVTVADTVDPCSDAASDPVPLSLRDAGFDRGRAACLRSDLGVTVAGAATIDTPDFYGTIAGAFRLSARFTRGDRIEWGIGARAVDYTFAQDAVIKATELRVGPIDAHVAYGGPLRVASDRDRWAIVATATVPYSSSTLADMVESAAQLAGVATVAASPRWTIHTRVATLLAITSSAAGDTTSGAFVVGSDAVAAVTRRLRLGLGADLQAGWRGAFDHLLVRAALQLRFGDAYRFVFAAGAPVGGQERIDLAVTLGLQRDL